MNNLYQVLTWMGTFLNKILDIELPWFDLTFGHILIGTAFFGILIGVIPNILTSISNSDRRADK